jgi:aminoglycoside phosphotransferase (APT) family kinase protein
LPRTAPISSSLGPAVPTVCAAGVPRTTADRHRRGDVGQSYAFDKAGLVCCGSEVILHDDEFKIDLKLVRALVDRAFPDFSRRPLQPFARSGSSNVLFRLGDDLQVRLPRQPGGSTAVDKERRWLPYVASALPVATPEVVAVGEPDLGYPERWSIVSWIEGEMPDVPPGPDVATTELADDLAGVIRGLRDLAVPPEALADPTLRGDRARPLSAIDTSTRQHIAACRTLPDLDLDLDACLRLWDEAVALPDDGTVSTPRWLHGDLLAENLLLNHGHLHAVLDFGGLAVGDPTVDLIVGWELLDRAGRDTFRAALDVNEVTWLHGRAWALAIALMTFPYYWHTMPDRCTARITMVHAVLEKH